MAARLTRQTLNLDRALLFETHSAPAGATVSPCSLCFDLGIVLKFIDRISWMTWFALFSFSTTLKIFVSFTFCYAILMNNSTYIYNPRLSFGILPHFGGEFILRVDFGNFPGQFASNQIRISRIPIHTNKTERPPTRPTPPIPFHLREEKFKKVRERNSSTAYSNNQHVRQ